ncbi:MAG: prepilin-type N-terminal cleavage/methylation domain-containing protein [Nitrospirae bacterium]|nr:prepilin-type N-terminal cleavage/methylation domain-containing protein [Nitrospirota bacterium]
MKDEKKYSSAFCFQPSTLNLQPFSSGFTLIELILVIFILSLMLALVMPSFRDMGGTLKTEAMHIAGALRYVNDEAVGKKQTYLLNINLNDESWGIEGNNEKKKTSLKGNVEIQDVFIPSLGEVSSGKVTIEFGPSGSEEPLIFHFKKDKAEYTVIFNHINGRVRVIEGYAL